MPNSANARAVVIGSGPNGLAAAITLARNGHTVTVHEGAAIIGGGARSAELTLPGSLHDTGSAVHPMAISSPCFDEWPLVAHGLEWVHPEAPLAHPFDDGTAAVLDRSIDVTARTLGADGARWQRIFEPLAAGWPSLRHDVLAPPLRIPRHPMQMARFGFHALRSARAFANSHFHGPQARGLFAGLAAHATMPLEDAASAGIGLVIGIAGHAVGWPFPRGGSGRLSHALAQYLRSLGGEVRTESRMTSLPDAGTVHIGGTFAEIARWESSHSGAPFLILAQPSLFDPARAPAGKHTAWAYCHVPNSSPRDMAAAMELQIERFAPGFRARILARHIMSPAALERDNPNLVGGDIGGGAVSLRQILFRPTRRYYRTPLAGVYLCSSSTPPGGGVHGMCGYHAPHCAVS